MTQVQPATADRRFAALVEEAYLAAVEPARWRGFLEHLVEATASRSARMLVLNDAADRVTSSLKVNIDDADHRAYVDHYVNACPWRPELANKPPGRLYSTYLDFSCGQREFYRTEFYNDWAGPQDIHHGICGTVYADGEQTVQLLVQRTEGQGHYTREDTDAVNALVPHVRRALLLGRHAARRDATAAAAVTAAASRALPFVLLDERGRVDHLHPDAEVLIGASGMLALKDGRLRVRRAAADARLRRLVQRATAASRQGWRGAGAGAGGGTLSLRPGEGTPLHLLVTPVHPELAGLQLQPQPAFAAVFLHDPAGGLSVDCDVLCELYGLTVAEARVAAAVALGTDPAALATELGVSRHTVRSQLKSVFRKTGTGRQAELARLVLTGPACRREAAGVVPVSLDGG